MRSKAATDSREDRLRRVEMLVGLSRLDWGYADLYLRDAEGVLHSLCTPEQFRSLAAGRGAVPGLVSDVRGAVVRGDWREAERLAEDALRIQRRLEGETRLLGVGDAVYGPRSLSPDAAGLALAGNVTYPVDALRSHVRELAKTLRSLAEGDSASESLYERRAAHFEGLEFDADAAAVGGADPAELRAAALAAVDAGDLPGMLRLARGARRAGRGPSGRARAPRPRSGWVERLADPFPDQAVARAAKLGLEPASVPARPELNAYLRCACADRPSLPQAALEGTHREPEGCTCGHACPPGVAPGLKSSLDALMVHPFVTSGGTRYLPWFGPEVALVEGFAEDGDESPAGLLQALGLPRRTALPRVRIEHALLGRGPALCAELDLDPQRYRLVCIPFDVYNRIGPERRWGRREIWTHFDGYQVTREFRLQALVGGDARFGGPDDLCGVARQYDSERITARFAIVRRERFEAREPRG